MVKDTEHTTTRTDASDVHRFTNLDPETRDDSNDPYTFQSLTGFFKYNEEGVPLAPNDSVHSGSSDFGLIKQDWEQVKKEVEELQANAEEGVVYKVFFCGRHAQGWHNVGNEKYDQITWDTDYARRNGDDEITWGPDAELTPKGLGQAADLNEAWKNNLAKGCPRPDKWFVSPFTRTADTMRVSFQGVFRDDDRPLFVEKFREIYGEQTCDKRRTKSFLKERFPFCDFEPDFAEEDPLWKEDERELEVDRRVRIREAVYKIFDETDDTYISITSHACATQSLCAILKHRIFKLGTAGMIPIVVKATKNKH